MSQQILNSEDHFRYRLSNIMSSEQILLCRKLNNTLLDIF